MIPLRIAFDMDGTLADLSSAYAEIEDRLFGPELAEHERPAPELREAEQHTEEDESAAATIGDNRRVVERRSARGGNRHRDRVWRAIEGTPNFWTTLKPLENGALKRLYQLTGEHNWEVFFITQRPATAGATVQWQTHKWLVDQGFSTPSVIPLSAGRGKCAAALQLDYLIDDTPQNCVDVLSDSSTRAILLVNADDPLAETSARRLGIGTAHNIHDVLDLLIQATAARANPSLFEKLRKLVGWK
jgi:FMN phosphatase YigB (HAD superfamily)